MTNRNHELPSRNVVWQLNVPQTVLELYFNYIRVLPSWKRNFPRYIPSTILDTVELGSNKTRIITESGEFVFTFEEKNTFVPLAAEYVKTGTLRVLYSDVPVLHLNVSPPDPHEAGNKWVARGIEEFRDGKWVAELTQLNSRFTQCEAAQRKNDELLRHNELQGVAELKEKFSICLPQSAGRNSWWRRLLRRSDR
jgi:hypothetical protein